MERLRGRRFKSALTAGIEWFSRFRRRVDEINVFPVADGDTGKNMHHAFQAALREIRGVRADSASEVAWAAARGALLGGRGCSGMILSGFFTGFAEAVGNRRTLTGEELARALAVGCLRARERIEQPVEGTILTVGEQAAREAAHQAQVSPLIFRVLYGAWCGAREALEKTRDQLNVLKSNNVVDAGGQGLVYFYEGLVRFAQGRRRGDAAQAFPAPPPRPAAAAVTTPHRFCTEFLLEPTSGAGAVASLREELAGLGEHVMVAGGPEGLVKAHVHTAEPHVVLARARNRGRVAWAKVDDMAKQHRERFGGGREPGA